MPMWIPSDYPTHHPKDSSICSAVFARQMTHCPYTLHCAAPSPEIASRLTQPFFSQYTLVINIQTDKHADWRNGRKSANNRSVSWLCLCVTRILVWSSKCQKIAVGTRRIRSYGSHITLSQHPLSFLRRVGADYVTAFITSLQLTDSNT